MTSSLRRVFLVTALMLGFAAQAAPGDFDPTFATRGMYTPAAECCGMAGASAIATQTDGKVLVAGFAQNGSAPFEAVVARLNPDGTLDGSFGSAGIARVSTSATLSSDVRSLAVQPDGGILAAGVRTQANGAVEHSFVFRLDRAGRLDTTFGASGIATLGPLVSGSPRTSARRVLVQPDGKIVVAGGLTLASGDTDMFAARLTSGGTPDMGFGTNGFTESGLVERDEGWDAAMAADGAIYVVGTAVVSNTNFGALMRLLANGQLDASFDNDGVKAPVLGFTSDLRSIAISSEGKLLLAGRLNAAAATLRFTAAGGLDTTYGNGGAITHQSSGIAVRIVPLAGDQTVVLVEPGFAGGALRVYRVNADGTADSSFASPTNTVSGFSGASRDGRSADLAVSGPTPLFVSGGGTSALQTYRLTSAGVVDTAYGTNGVASVRPGLAVPSAELFSVAIGATGDITIVRRLSGGTDTLLTRLTPDGREDPAFGTGGRARAGLDELGNAAHVALKPNGKILIGFQFSRIRQLNADGSADAGFTTPNFTSPVSLVPLADNRFLAASGTQVGRFLDSGALDPTFNFGQLLAVSSGAWSSAAIDGSGGVILAGTASNHGFVERREANAGLDFSFGTNGRVTVNAGQSFTDVVKVLVQADGRILVAGVSRQSSPSPLNTVFAARLNANGTLDPGFGTGGVARAPLFGQSPGVRSLAIQADGRILVAGSEGPSATRGFVWRFHSDGKPDEAFGVNGLKLIDTTAGSERANFVGVQPNGGIIVAGLASGTTPAVWRLFGSDTGPGGPAASLVSSYYRTILGRDADGAGQSFWEGELARVTSLGASASETFYVMAATFFGSAEYTQRNTTHTQFVTDLYRTFFQREPDNAGRDFWVGQVTAGRPRQAILNEFLFSAEFAGFMGSLFGAANLSRPNTSMVMDFYRGLLHRLPDSSGLDFWADRLRAAACSGTVVNEADSISGLFLSSQEYANRRDALPAAERNAAYVLDLYSAFLRRGAEAEGFRFFRDQLDSGAQTREQVRRQFVTSAEFQARVQAVQNMGCQG